MSWLKGLTSLQGHWLRPAKGWAPLLRYADWCDSAIWMGVLGRTLAVLSKTLSVPWESQGAAQVTWGHWEVWLDKTCPRRNSTSKLWIGNEKRESVLQPGTHLSGFIPIAWEREAGWGRLPQGCSTCVCLSLALLGVRSISTIQTSILWGTICVFVWKSRLGYCNTEPQQLCTLALYAQFGVLKDL